MDKSKAAQKLTEEIMQEFRLPNLCRNAINIRIHMAIGVGIDIGHRACLDEQKILKCKPVIQLSKEGKVVKTWESITAAEKALGISSGNITGVLNPNIKKRPIRHTAGGFKWKYVDEDDRVKQDIIKKQKS